MRQNENRKKCVKKICQCNYEKKRFIQSFKPRKEILKLKIKIKKYSIIVLFLREAVEENGCYGEWRFKNAIQLLIFLFIATNIRGATNCD